MFDILPTITFNCNFFRKRKDNLENLDCFLDTISKEKDKNIIVSQILLKITNGVYKSSMLYKYTFLENHFFKNELIKIVGNTDIYETFYCNLISIPLFIDSKLKYSLVILYENNKKIKLSKKTLRLIDLLEKYLD